MDRRGRILLIVALIGLGFALVAGRLVYLQVIDRADLAARAERQQQRVVKLEPKRGTIYDRQKRELAVSLDVESVYGVPSDMENPRQMAQQLSRILREDPKTLERRLTSDKHFVWISRKVEPGRAAKVKDLGSKEVGLRFESRRFYPKKSLLSTSSLETSSYESFFNFDKLDATTMALMRLLSSAIHDPAIL